MPRSIDRWSPARAEGLDENRPREIRSTWPPRYADVLLELRHSAHELDLSADDVLTTTRSVRKRLAKYASMARSNHYQPGDMRYEQRDRVTESATHLAENFHRAPMMLIPCIEGRLDGVPAFAGASQWGSILPAVWSFMMALRERSMGSAWTTIHLMDGGEAEAAELLGIPHDRYTQAGLFPIAYTVGTEFKLAKRLPLDTVLHWDVW